MRDELKNENDILFNALFSFYDHFYTWWSERSKAGAKLSIDHEKSAKLIKILCPISGTLFFTIPLCIISTLTSFLYPCFC